VYLPYKDTVMRSLSFIRLGHRGLERCSGGEDRGRDESDRRRIGPGVVLTDDVASRRRAALIRMPNDKQAFRPDGALCVIRTNKGFGSRYAIYLLGRRYSGRTSLPSRAHTAPVRFSRLI